MFRSLVMLLLLDFAYMSFGVPVPIPTTNANDKITKLMTELASDCKNDFLSAQIRSKIESCANLGSQHNQKQIGCLLFYDINKQLCGAVAGSKLVLTGDISPQINEKQDINLFCGNTKDWVFSNLDEYPSYKSTVEKFFKHPITCGKLCGVEDVVSDDANFHCKYFKWGRDMLTKQESVSETHVNSVQPADIENAETKPALNDLSDMEVKSNKFTTGTLDAPIVAQAEKTQETGKLETSSVNNQVSEPKIKSPEKPVLKTDEEGDPLPGGDSAAEQPNVIPDVNGEINLDAGTTITKPGTGDAKKGEPGTQQIIIDTDNKEGAAIEAPIQGQSDDKLSGDPEDQGEAADEDMQDDEDDEPEINDNAKDVKDTIKEPETLKVATSGNTGNGVQDLYPTYGRDYPEDDDNDHFFSFFITAVVMVVVIYILYHNKNKVTKVFFGLILEGRQNVRRTSRGHAYKRLDTLEQAMNTKATAPPSQIIY